MSRRARTFVAKAAILVALVSPAAALAADNPFGELREGAYAPSDAGCDASMSDMFFVENGTISMNKTDGVIQSFQRRGSSYTLNMVWIEREPGENGLVAGSRADGERDTVRFVIKSRTRFVFSNTRSQPTEFGWCS